MTEFRGTDEQIDREIATLERIAHLRVRRTAAELRELDRDLRELRKERARRKAVQEIPVPVSESTATVVEES
ncbi:MAG: hypothetical protein ABSB97_01880 [Thermoplasmata archaeon]|jgi:hypothetical protein